MYVRHNKPLTTVLMRGNHPNQQAPQPRNRGRRNQPWIRLDELINVGRILYDALRFIISLIGAILFAPRALSIISALVSGGWVLLFSNLPYFLLGVALPLFMLGLIVRTRSQIVTIITIFIFVVSIALPTFTYISPPHTICHKFDEAKHITKAAIQVIEHHQCEKASKTQPPSPTLGTTLDELPYIAQTEYLAMIGTYVCAIPVKRTLVAWGAKGVGKSTGLITMSTKWTSTGRKVVRINLAGFSGGFEDFVDMFRNEVIAALTTIEFSREDQLVFHTCVGAQNESLRLEDSLLSSYLKDFGLDVAAHSEQIETAHWLRKWKNYISSYFVSRHNIASVDFPGLIRLLNLIAFQLPHNAPIVVFSELQSVVKLGKEGVKTVIDILKTLEAVRGVHSLVPVIIETSDLIWSMKLLRSEDNPLQQTFYGYKVEEFTKEQAYKVLVQNYNVLLSEEFEELWTAVGGHAGTFSDIYFCYRAGLTMKAAIEKQIDTISQRLREVVEGSNNREAIREALIQISETGFYPLDDSYAVLFLLKKNIVCRVDNYKAVPQHSLLQTAITAYAKIANYTFKSISDEYEYYYADIKSSDGNVKDDDIMASDD